MIPRMFALPATVALISLVSPNAMADNAAPQPGIYAFGPDQTIADVSKLGWAPLQLDGLPAGAERRDLCMATGPVHLHRGRRPSAGAERTCLYQSAGQHAARPALRRYSLHVLPSVRAAVRPARTFNACWRGDKVNHRAPHRI